MSGRKCALCGIEASAFTRLMNDSTCLDTEGCEMRVLEREADDLRTQLAAMTVDRDRIQAEHHRTRLLSDAGAEAMALHRAQAVEIARLREALVAIADVPCRYGYSPCGCGDRMVVIAVGVLAVDPVKP